MNSTVLNLIQGLTDPGDLASGISSFFRKHTSRIRDLLTDIVDKMPADPDDTGVTFDLGEGTVVISNDSTEIKSFEIPDLTAAIKAVLNDSQVVPNVPISVRNISTGVVTTESITHDQVIELLREQSDLADGLITTLNCYQDWINNPDLNFEQLNLDRINNLLPSNSVVADKLKQGISSIATRFSDSIRDYSPAVLQNVMALFGIGATEYTEQQVSTFSGVNAWTVVLGDIIDGVQYIVAQAPGFITRLFGTIGFAIGKLVEFAVDRLNAAVEKAIISMTGADNAFRARTIPGDGTVNGCDWRYTADKTHYSSGSTAFQNFIDHLDAFWENRESNEISVPLFAGTLNMQLLSSGKTGFNLRLKPLNCTAIEVAWNKTMSDSHLFYNLIQAYSGLISRNPNSDDYPITLTRDNLIQFFNELAKNPSMYYMDGWKTDADAFMSCQCAKIICFAQLLLMIDNPPTPPGFLGMLLNCSDLADFDIENEPNYSGQSQALEPSNFNMLNYLSSLKKGSTAFNNSAGDSNDYTPNNYTMIANLDTLWRLLDNFITVIEDLDVLSDSGLTVFLPYHNNIVYKRSSYYIPTDTENIDVVKGILKAGLTVAAVAAVVLIGLKVRSSIKKKAFELDAKAGALSWKAAEEGDVTGIKKAYKLSKRANILSNVGGYLKDSTSDTVSSFINNNTNAGVVPVEVKDLALQIKTLIAG